MGKLNRQKKNLGLIELISIAIGGMVGGGIFSILGISVTMVGYLTPIAIIIGGIIALLAAYSYVKLGVYYKDEGATYSFVKRTFSNSSVIASFIGWLVIFGYISTLALYSYTFSSYAISGTDFANSDWVRKFISWGIILIFTLINVWSVVGMGKIEDIMVYTKLIILFVISLLLIKHGQTDFSTFIQKMVNDVENSSVLTLLIVSSITFVAYEGFQLTINAVKEMENPEKNIPRAIYIAILIVISIYVVMSLGAIFAIPFKNLISGKEYALASGAKQIIGDIGQSLVIFGAVLATSSAISGTMFGSSRQLAVIAEDGFMPKFLAKRNKKNIPVIAIISMALLASLLILIGGLKLFLEFGSVTFLMVSILVAITNFIIRDKTGSSPAITIIAILGLSISGVLILYYELTNNWYQMLFIISIYFLLGLSAYFYSKQKK